MVFSLKRKACDALGKENFFSASSAADFIKQSTYGNKKEWLQEIQAGKVKYYASSLENDVSQRRRNNFRQLCKLQVAELLPEIRDDKIRTYATLLSWLHDDRVIVHQRENLYKTVNRLEDEIINEMEDFSIDDLRRFLKVAVLYSDRNHLYNIATTENFNRICEAVK